MLFWPEIRALGVFFSFDNERMRPPKSPSAPHPPGIYFACIYRSDANGKPRLGKKLQVKQMSARSGGETMTENTGNSYHIPNKGVLG